MKMGWIFTLRELQLQQLVNIFRVMFTGEEKLVNEDVLNCIPRMIIDEQNHSLQAMPIMAELKQVVFAMSPHSAAGPDGMNEKFYQSCWDIIKVDLAVLQSFFYGHIMPKYSHACLVLLPKVDHPNKLSEFRPQTLATLPTRLFPNSFVQDLLLFYLTSFLKISLGL